MDTQVKLCKTYGSPRIDATLFKITIKSLRYLVNARLDIAYSVGVVSHYIESPISKHLAAVKQILRYIKGTLSRGCSYV